MSELVSAIGDAASGVADGMVGVLRGVPHTPPPPRTPPPLRPPLLPPNEPPDIPPASPLVVCPPSWPPPSTPPGFSEWSAHVPAWAWWMFSVLVSFAAAGFGAIVYIVRELRTQKRGFGLPREDTAKTLADLERRMSKRGF